MALVHGVSQVWNLDHQRHERKRFGLSPRQQRKRQRAMRRLEPRKPSEPEPFVPWAGPLNDRPQSTRECQRRLRQLQAGIIR